MTEQLVLERTKAEDMEVIDVITTGDVRPDTSVLLPLAEYDLIVCCLSGGKDSVCCLLLVLEECRRLGIPLERVEAWHQLVDGAPGPDAPEKFDWPVTDSYCADLCRSLGVVYRRQWREGGIAGEMLKANARTQGMTFEMPDGTLGHAGGTAGAIGTRGRHPAQSADLQSRWCSPVAKIDVCNSAICNDPRLAGAKVLLITGERREESSNRARYATVERRKGTTLRRRVDHWRSILEYSEADVWSVLERNRVRPHPAYFIGFPRVSCMACFTGDTMVVTRQGIRQISDLAGGTHDLLVPKLSHGGLHGHGSFHSAPVRSFGPQAIVRLKLQRHRQTKEVYTTAEHRWFVQKNIGSRKKARYCTEEKTTNQLASGDTLRSLMAHPTDRMTMVPFAVAQGFVYGDGTKGSADRPATLTICNEEKYRALSPFFPAHAFAERPAPDYATGKEWHVYGLPRLWKHRPDFRETRTFLLSWLAGYFAADGCVSEAGQAKISSSRRASLQIARDVAAVCGVGYGCIHHSERVGKGKGATRLYTMTLNLRDLPEWFFLLSHHRERRNCRAAEKARADRLWRVVAVEATGRTEEVFCATVSGVAAFALADGIMTGNCIFNRPEQWQMVRELAPEKLAWHAAVESKSGHTIRRGLTVIQQADRGAALASPGVSDPLVAANKGLCMNQSYPAGHSMLRSDEPWQTPAGAFKDGGCGPS